MAVVRFIARGTLLDLARNLIILFTFFRCLGVKSFSIYFTTPPNILESIRVRLFYELWLVPEIGEFDLYLALTESSLFYFYSKIDIYISFLVLNIKL